MKNPAVQLLKHTWQYSTENHRSIVIFIILSIFANVVLLATPLVLGHAFDKVQFSSNDPRLPYHLIACFWSLVVINALFWMLHGPSRVMEVGNAFRVRAIFKLSTLSYVFELPNSWHDDNHSGDTIDKTYKAGEASYNFAEGIFMIISNVIRVAGSVIILMLFDICAGIIALVVCVITFSMLMLFDKRLIEGYQRVRQYENNFASTIHDYLSCVITIITLRLKNHVQHELEKRSMEGFSIHQRNAKINETKWGSTSMIISIMTATVLSINTLVSFKTNGVVLLSTLFILFQYLQGVGETFYNFAFLYGDFVRHNVSVSGTDQIRATHRQLEIKHDVSVRLPENWNRVSMSNVSFAYANGKGREGKNHLDEISLGFSRGQRVAFIGESGSGKSTALLLIRGLYEPHNARVQCDNVELPFGIAHIYDHVTLFPQHPEIFNRDIRYNITIGAEVSPKILDQVIKLAQLETVVRRLPKELETSIAEKGVNLSGGERQRLALARGFLASFQRDIMLLDEPTSSVDSVLDRKIHQGMFDIFQGKTIISSIHRLHLLPLFDYIYLFKDGRIIANGTFNELMAVEKFHTMWEHYQFTNEQGEIS